MKIEWNEEGLADMMSGLQQNFDAAAQEHTIPEGSSVEEIEAILTAQMRASGIEPNVEGIHEQAVEIHAQMSEG